jgi:hypothetical protein
MNTANDHYWQELAEEDEREMAVAGANGPLPQ